MFVPGLCCFSALFFWFDYVWLLDYLSTALLVLFQHLLFPFIVTDIFKACPNFVSFCFTAKSCCPRVEIILFMIWLFLLSSSLVYLAFLFLMMSELYKITFVTYLMHAISSFPAWEWRIAYMSQAMDPFLSLCFIDNKHFTEPSNIIIFFTFLTD